MAQGVRHRGNLIEIRLVGERRRDGIAGSLKLCDRQHIALAVIGVGSLATQSIGDTEQEIGLGLPFIGRGLGFGLTERISDGVGEALVGEGKPFHVSSGISDIGLDHLAVSVECVGELIGDAVSLRLGRHLAIAVIGVGHVEIAVGFFSGQQPMGPIVGIGDGPVENVRERTDMRPVIHHQMRGRVAFIGSPVGRSCVCCAGAGVLALGSTPSGSQSTRLCARRKPRRWP